MTRACRSRLMDLLSFTGDKGNGSPFSDCRHPCHGGSEPFVQSYNRAMQGGFLAGFMMDPDEGRQLTVSYLLYASDKIILCGNVPTSCLFGHVCGVF